MRDEKSPSSGSPFRAAAAAFSRAGAPRATPRDPSVYIAHAMSDGDVAKLIARRLSARSYRIESQSAAAADVILALWSAEAVNSRWVLDDAEAAAKRDALVEAMIDPVASPLDMRPILPPVDLTEGRGDVRGPGWSALVERLEQAVGPRRAPASSFTPLHVGALGAVTLAAAAAVVIGVQPDPVAEPIVNEEPDLADAATPIFGVGGPYKPGPEPESAPLDSGVFALTPVPVEPLAPMERMRFAPVEEWTPNHDPDALAPNVNGPPP